MKKIIGLKPVTIIDIISALFILLFLYTALSKSFQIGSTVKALKKTPGLSSYAGEIAWGIVMLEYLAAALLFLPHTRKGGLYISLGLLISFTGYIAYMIAFVPDLPCSCGGVISKMTWSQHLIFNILFILLAFSSILLERRQNKINSEGNDPTPIVFT